MTRIRFSEFAKNELNDACDWYERQQEGLGARFKRDVRESTLRIAASPLLFPVELGDVRRYVMNRFPFTLRYSPRKRILVTGGAGFLGSHHIFGWSRPAVVSLLCERLLAEGSDSRRPC